MQSIRLKLTLLFLVTIVLPIVIIAIIFPTNYQRDAKNQRAYQMQDTLKALTYNIEIYLDDLDQMTIAPYYNDDVMWALTVKANNRWQTLSSYEQFRGEQALAITLPKYLKSSRDDLLGTFLIPMDGSIYFTSSSGYGNTLPKNDQFLQQQWYIKAIEANGSAAFVGSIEKDVMGSSSGIFSVSRLIKDPDSQRPIAVMMAAADSAALEKLLSSISLEDGAIATIIDEQANIIYANHTISEQLRTQLTTQTLMAEDTHEQYSVVSHAISYANWHIVVLFPESQLKKEIQQIYFTAFGLAALGIFIAIILFFTLSYWIVTPFKQMIKIMKLVQRGNFSVKYEVRGNDEIALLGSNLNIMINRLEQMIDRELRAVMKQQNAEYRALQSQIQPHFLYNTLSGFIGLNRTGQRELLERAILSLSGLMRYTLEHKDWVELREEIQFITKYCELQKMRFSDKLDIQLNCGQGTEHIYIPKLLLQPILENAIIHGIEPSDTACLLRIDTRLVDLPDKRQLLEINITDNGIGYNPETVKEGVGIKNIRERLQLSYNHSSITILSEPNKGTSVIIQIQLEEVNLHENINR